MSTYLTHLGGFSQRDSHTSTHLIPRAMSTDNRTNIIIGVMTIVISFLSVVLAWATWRLTHERRSRSRSVHMSPAEDRVPLVNLPPARPGLGYELAFRFGRTLH